MRCTAKAVMSAMKTRAPSRCLSPGAAWVIRRILSGQARPDRDPTAELVQRLQLEYTQQPAASLLTAAHLIGYVGQQAQFNPPMEFDYSPFVLSSESARFSPLFTEQTPRQDPGVDAGLYQLVDLYGDGLAGILYSLQNAWYYRRPIRDPLGQGINAVGYAPRELLRNIPVANLSSPTLQVLTDLNGDGKLDWLVAQPSIAGFFTLDTCQQWSHFTPYAAFPTTRSAASSNPWRKPS